MSIFLLWARSSPAVYAAPIGVGLILYIAGDDIGLQPRSWSQVFNMPLMYQFYTAGIASVAAAWDIGRLRRGDIRVLLPVRNKWSVIGLALLPGLLLGFLLQSVFWVVLALRLSGVEGGLPWVSIAAVSLSLVAWALIGAAIGWVLPAIAAVPVAVGFAFSAMAYSVAIPDPKWRNITGDALSLCCEVDAVARPEVWWATLLPLVGFAGASLVLLAGSGSSKPRSMVAALLAVGAIGFALPYGATIAWEPTQPRGQSELHCEPDAGLEICLWPEYEPMRADLSPRIREVAAEFESFGVETPSTIVQDGHDETGQWGFVASPHFSDAELRRSVAFGLIADNYESCQFDVATEYGPLLSDDIRLVMGDWLNHTILGDTSAPGYTDGTEFEDFLQQLYTLEPHKQGAWFNQLNTALHNCEANAIPGAFAQTSGDETR